MLIYLRDASLAAEERCCDDDLQSVVRDYLRAKLLRELPLRLGVDLAGYGLLTGKRSELSEPASAFVSLLRTRVK